MTRLVVFVSIYVRIILPFRLYFSKYHAINRLQMTKQQNQESDGSSSNLSFGKILLLGCGAIAILFLLQKGGIKSVYKDETTKRVDFKSAEYQNRGQREPSAEAEDEGTDEILADIDRAYGNSKTASKVYEAPQKPLTGDEKVFFQKLKNSYATDPNLRDSDNWLSVMKGARRTYTEVQDIFETIRISNDETVAQTLSSPKQAEIIFRELERRFELPVSLSKNFPGTTVSDWALFVVQNQK